MFDGSFPGPAAVAEVGDGELIDAITGWSATAAAAQARMFAALAEWHRRATSDPEQPNAAADDLDNAAAQVACALSVSQGRAHGLMDTAVVLRDRLPQLGRRFLAGQVCERVVARIVWQCAFVVDDTVWAALDEQFAHAATTWGQLSGAKLDTAIEVWLHLHDPDAVRRAHAQLRSRDFQIGTHDDATGTTSVWGRLHSVDAAIAAQRIRTMINRLCDHDPRTTAQQRADAVGAVFAGASQLTCLCGTPDCPAAGVPDARADNVMVHVVADHSALTATPDPTIHGPDPAPAPDPVPAPEPAPERARPGVLLGRRLTVLPAATVADLIARGATVRVVGDPNALPANPGYRPRTALDEFVRARDLTCRHPGCDRPAVYADLDHSQPWPAGPTHPGNLNGKCRLHHLLKTFWAGWTEHQHPDGTLRITTPTGHTYTTRPFSTLLFPSWTTTTDPPPRPATPPPPPTPGRGVMMPTRRHTRAAAKAAHITRERARNATHRELDRLAKHAAAEQRRTHRDALRATSPKAAAWADRQDAIAHHRQTLNSPTAQPDYSDDPPPF